MVEQVELENPQHPVQSPAQPQDELQVGQELSRRHPQLRQNCVLRAVHEALHLQILLDPVEEQLILPARLVEAGNRLSHTRRVCSSRTRSCGSFPCPSSLPAAAWPDRLAATRTRQLARLVAHHGGPNVNVVVAQHAVFHVPLQPGHERHVTLVQVQIRAVGHHHAGGRERPRAGNTDGRVNGRTEVAQDPGAKLHWMPRPAVYDRAPTASDNGSRSRPQVPFASRFGAPAVRRRTNCRSSAVAARKAGGLARAKWST